MTIPYTMTNDTITVIYQGKSTTTQKSAPNFISLRNALIAEAWDDVPAHLTVALSLEKWAKGKFTLAGNQFKYLGHDVPQSINSRIIEMARTGEDPTCLFNFWERLSKNPSFRSVTQLFDFLRNSGIPITETGYVLGYKSVRPDYKDHHSGTLDNHPGAKNVLPRNEISDDPNLACHVGLHIGSLQYAQTFGESDRRIVVCKVDPEHVVCVPYDCSQQKMRVCEYEVIGNLGSELPSTTFKPDPEAAPTAEVDDENSLEEDLCDECGENEDWCDCHDHEDDDCANCGEHPDDCVCEEGTPLTDPDSDPPKKSISDSQLKVSANIKAPPPNKGGKMVAIHAFHKLDMAGLMEQSLQDLRSYASGSLAIVGASKIPGGKTALVLRILEVKRS